MVVFFVEESNKNKIFKHIEVNEDKIIINKKVEKISKKDITKIYTILKNKKCEKVLISKKLKNNDILKKLIYSNNISIVNGKILYKMLLEKIIEASCKNNDINTKECQIAFMVNYLDSNVTKLIKNVSKTFKSIIIVTNNFNSFKQLKENLYNNEGIIITITNNKRKALLKSGLIVNYDFPEEIINKYSIYDNSVIINTEEPINIHKKRFNGKIINDYNIVLKKNSDIEIELKKEKYKKYDIKDLTEVFIMQYPEEICNVIV